MCKTSYNSPASRPEFVDLSLNSTSGDVQQSTTSEEEEITTIAEEGNSNDDQSIYYRKC